MPGTKPSPHEIVAIEFKHDREIFVAEVGESIRQVAEITGRGSAAREVRVNRTFRARVLAIIEGEPWLIITDGSGQSEWAPQIMVQGQPRRVTRK